METREYARQTCSSYKSDTQMNNSFVIMHKILNLIEEI